MGRNMNSTPASGRVAVVDEPGQGLGPDRIRDLAKPLGGELAATYSKLLDSVPGAPHRPSKLARQLGVSRVIVSKLMNAVTQPDPFEVLEKAPGPESLRAIANATLLLDANPELANQAMDVADRFAAIIRDEFGTRSAFNAALSPYRPMLRTRLAHQSRYQIFLGMRQVLGVTADTWFTSMMFRPAEFDEEILSVTTIHGAIGMRRLRPDANVYFTYGPPDVSSAKDRKLSKSTIDLREFCTHKPAPLESEMAAGQLVYRLNQQNLGRQAKVDMLTVSHDERGSKRFATPERQLGGMVVFPDVPVKTLIIDALLHDDAFPGSTPQLMVFNPGARGPASPNDPRRAIDRVEVTEEAESLGKQSDRFDLAEVPNYSAMIQHVFGKLGYASDRFRVFRLRMSYPVHGFQFVMAFQAPTKK